MNANEKGMLGLIEVIRDLTKKGYEVFTPIHDYSAVDIIVLDKNHIPKRIQVKYRTMYRDVIDVAFSTSVNGQAVPINQQAIDGWAIYLPEVDRVVYVSTEQVDFSKHCFSFRLTEGKNSVNVGKVKRRVYTDFLDEKVIWIVTQEAEEDSLLNC